MKENQICQCCLSEECYKNMFKEYINGDTKENYGELLLNTFNINISNPKQKPFYICEKCIAQLRQATSFKQQVLIAQDCITKGLNATNIDVQLKIEVDLDDLDDKVSEEISDSDFLWDDKRKSKKGQAFVIKLGPKDDNAENKVPKTIPSVCKKVLNTPCVKEVVTASDLDKLRSKKSNTRDVVTRNKTKTAKGKQKNGGGKYEARAITQKEIDARENTLKLGQNSNLCLFRSLKTKFGCFMCNMAFVEASKLREHSRTHNPQLLAHRISRWRGLSYKNADISNLECNICKENIADLTELMSHLKEKHDVTYSGTDTYLIPYKLADENQCTLCENKFNSFLRLSVHMNSHYTNNVCEICGRSYINRISLRTHMQSMHREKKCPHCPAKFLTDSSKVAHLKKVHKVFNMKRYCNLCDKTFPYTYLLVKHKIADHGAKKTIINCIDCGKTFFDAGNLKVHVRSVHIRERNYPCQICGTRFFTKCDQRRHEKTHNDVRSFTCSYCDGKFKSKDSWRRHMKRQHGHVFT